MNKYYEKKYIKYKKKYILLKQELELENIVNTNEIDLMDQIGGKTKVRGLTNKDLYMIRANKRKKELSHMKTTKSYIPKSKLTSRNKIYDIHDNGGRPFRVTCNINGIYIQKAIGETDEDEIIYGKVFKHITNFEGYWVGFDTSPYSSLHGNSLLVKINKNKYMHIGDRIYLFKTKDEIIDFVSPVGNSDVPYPIAYGTQNVYFMLDDAYVPIEKLVTKPTVANAEDIYGEFHGHLDNIEKKSSISIPMIGYRLVANRNVDYSG